VTPLTAKGAESPSCGCRAAGSRQGSGLAALAALALGLFWRRRGSLLLLASLGPLGCGNTADAPTSPQPDDGSECSGDFDTFEPGMTTQALPGDITVELTRADPSPPVVRRDNVWWLKLTDADGNALSGAEVVASPYMPKHQHGSAEVVVEEQGEGEYQLSPIELIMPGVWEIPLSVTPAGGVASETTFRFCIAER
jgi:MYXO-CTERM domain-containing protein